MYYDPNLNITWLTEPYNTLSVWGAATLWTSTLNVDGITGWRLPAYPNHTYNGGSYDDEGEMGYLYYDDLGNVVYGPLSNKGPFTDLQPYLYWTDTEIYSPYFGPDTRMFDFGIGGQTWDEPAAHAYALAVHDGDPAAVPEPSTLLLLGPGLAGLWVWGRKKFKRI